MSCRAARLPEHKYTIVTDDIPPQFGNPYKTPESTALIWRGERDTRGKQILVEHPWFGWERYAASCALPKRR